MIVVKDMYYRHPQVGTPVLNGVSFNADSGALTTILGPNGSGKTTLLKCMCGLWPPQSGDVTFNGQTIRGKSFSAIAKIIALVPQEHEPPFPYSVLDAVTMGRAAHLGMFSAPCRHDYRKAEDSIERVGIGHLKDRPYTRISGGERQLVLIARALTQESPVMLLDEPTSHLDFKNQVLVLTKVKELVKEKNVAALMTIHDPNLAMLFSDRVVILNNGSVEAQGTPTEVMTENNLSSVYGIGVCVIPVNGSKVITPRL